MKKILIITLLSLSSYANADICQKLAIVSYLIMEQYQHGASKQEIKDVITNEDKNFKKYYDFKVDQAFKQPKYETETFKENAAVESGNQTYKICKSMEK